jgi:drug/metabolite transporter (DMT)-like permease
MGVSSAKPWWALVVALIGISWGAPLARLADVDGVTAAWWRLLVGSSLTVAFTLFSRGHVNVSRALAHVALPSGAALGLHFASWFESLRYASVASSTGIVSTYPIVAAFYEMLVTREVAYRQLAGVLLGFAGIVVLSTPWAGATPRGAILALVGSLSAAAYFLLGRRARVRGYSTADYTSLTYTSAFIVVAVYSLAAGGRPWAAPRSSIPFLVLLGVVPMLMGHSMMNFALRFFPATVVTSVGLLEPYGASLLAWLVLGERPPLASLVGLLLAGVGAHLVLSGERGGGR